jgi:hypothetical protein
MPFEISGPKAEGFAEPLCRLKINNTLGFKTCISAWYTGPHGCGQKILALQFYRFLREVRYKKVNFCCLFCSFS